MRMQEERAIKLPWDEVSRIISTEIEQVVGIKIQCKSRVAENEFWSIEFTDQHLSLPQYCQFLQAMNPTAEDWVDALPDEVRPEIKDIGPYTGEIIIAKHLQIAWEHRVIARDALWLVGVTEIDSVLPRPDKKGCALPDDLAQAVKVIADHLHQQEDHQ